MTPIMKRFAIVPLFFAFPVLMFSQDSLPPLPIKYKVTITTTKYSIERGYLAAISDSQLYVSPVSVRFTLQPKNGSQYRQYDYRQLKSVAVTRKGHFGRQFFSSAVIGTIGGALLGLIILPDYNSSNLIGFETGTRVGIGAFAGFITGSIIGSIKGLSATKTFIINGKKDKFSNMQFRLSVMERISASSSHTTQSP